MPTKRIDAARVKFHQHLDVCQRCREHPMELCEVGDKLLRETQPTLEEAEEQKQNQR